MTLAWLVTSALAATTVVVADGPLVPGRAAVLQGATLTETGAPAVQPPALTVEGGALLSGPEPVRPGVWQWRVVPELDSKALIVQTSPGERESFSVSWPAPSTLRLPEIVDVLARGEPVSLEVRSDGPLPVDMLEVFSSEGEPRLRPGQDGQSAQIELVLDDLPYPRWVALGVRDKRREEEPAWTLIRAKARVRIPLKAEPAAKLSLKVGGRSYGPFVADADGGIDARLEQYPGELSAQAVLTDDLGNETRTEVPLVSQPAPALVAVASSELLPARPPPLVFLRAVSPEGTAPSGLPSCRAADQELPVRVLREGHYVVPLPQPLQSADVRLSCALGSVSRTLQIPVVSGVAERLSLRVWPDELLADQPTAELSLVLDDVRGESLPASGLSVEARHGSVALQDTGGMVARGTYDGRQAASAGEDLISARYRAPAGSGPVQELQLGFGAVPAAGGSWTVHARALDDRRRPRQGVPILLSVGASGKAELVTGPDGWATGVVTLPAPARGAPRRPLLVSARTPARPGLLASAVALPGERAYSGPGAPDLEVSQALAVRPGRVSGISISVEPDILRAGPGAVAWVFVELEDSAGRAVDDEPVELSATEGSLGELRSRPDGTLVAEYTPLPADGTREIEITASTASVRSSTTLLLEPRVVRLSMGPWAGGHTNFGSIVAPAGGFDVDMRIRSRLVGEAMILRWSGSLSSFRSEAVTDVGPPAELRSVLVPVGLGVLFRQDLGPWAVWAGAGAMLAAHSQQVRFGDRLASQGMSLLIGQQLMVGMAHRAPLGEIVFTIQGSRIPAGDEDVGYRGNLGGLQGGLGWRVVY
jgi:hypothetical protein